MTTARGSFTTHAEADLEDIGDFIARRDAARAGAFIGELRERCFALADHGHSFRLRPEYGPTVRGVPHGRYMILFTQHAGAVVILRIVHSARDMRRLRMPPSSP